MYDLVISYINFNNGYLSGAEHQLDCGYIGSYLIKNNAGVHQYINKDPNSYAVMIDELKAFSCTNYLFYVNEYNYYLTKVIVNKLKQAKPRARLLLAGPSAEHIGLKLMKDINADACITAEAPFTLLDILKKNRLTKDINNLIYKEDSQIIVTAKRLYDYSLDDLGFPYSSGYIPVFEIQNTGMMTSSGCYGNCLFCSYNKQGGEQFRLHSIDSVINEIEYINRHIRGADIYLNFLDDCFSGSAERTMKLCEALLNKGLKYRYWCCTRADLLTGELIELMAKCNFKEIVIGLETASPKTLSTLGKIRKGDTPEAYIRNLTKVFELCREKGISPFISANFGLPNEDYEDALATVEFIKAHNARGNASICYMTAFPGSLVFDRSGEYMVEKKEPPTKLPYRTYYKPYIFNIQDRLKRENIINLDTYEKSVRANAVEFFSGISESPWGSMSIKNILLYEINDQNLSFVDANIALNGNLLMYKEGLHTKKNSFYCDNRKQLKIDIREYNENLEAAYNADRFIPNQIFYRLINGEAYIQNNDIVTGNINRIKIRSMRSKEDYYNLSKEANLFNTEKIIAARAVKQGIIENGCRLTGTCALKGLDRVTLREGVVLGCGEGSIIGTVHDSYEKLAMYINACISNKEKSRDCNLCGSCGKCSVCLFVPSCFTDEEFCAFIKQNQYMGDYIRFINYYHTMEDYRQLEDSDRLRILADNRFEIIKSSELVGKL